MQERKIIALLRERGRAGAARPAGTRWAAVRYVIVPILRDPQEREECLSEVTMRVWEKIDTFQEERGSWNGWLTSLTRHAALNHARRISRHGGAEALSEDPPSPELTPEEVLLRQERQTALGTNLWGLNYLLPGIGLVLMLLGFRLLRREEIEACRGAIQVVVSVQEFDQKGGFCRSSGSNPLCITGVRVKLTGEPAGWMIFHHSLWNTAPPFHGTAAIQLCRYTSRMSCGAPPERSPAGFCTIGTGRPSRRPTTLWRRIHPPYGYQGIYGQRDIFGTFSLSTAAQHGRGYVVYAADEIPHAEYRNVPDSRFNYSYPYRFLQYPAKTALENRMSDHGAFRTVWSDLRYGPEVTPPVIKKNDQRNDPPAFAGGSF